MKEYCFQFSIEIRVFTKEKKEEIDNIITKWQLDKDLSWNNYIKRTIDLEAEKRSEIEDIEYSIKELEERKQELLGEKQ